MRIIQSSSPPHSVVVAAVHLSWPCSRRGGVVGVHVDGDEDAEDLRNGVETVKATHPAWIRSESSGINQNNQERQLLCRPNAKSPEIGANQSS